MFWLSFDSGSSSKYSFMETSKLHEVASQDYIPSNIVNIIEKHSLFFKPTNRIYYELED